MKAFVCVDNDSRYDDVLSAVRWCLAPGNDDEVHLAHVVVPLRWMPRRSEDDPGWAGTERAILDRVQDFLEQAATRFEDVTVRPLVLEGDAPDEILRAAAEHQVDYIVMGSVGQARSQDFLVGSVAEKIAFEAGRSVLLVRGAGVHGSRPCRALLAVDGSEASLSAVRSFASLPSARAAEIQLLHVVELPPVTWDLDVEGIGNLDESTPPVLQERADRAVESARKILADRDLKAEVKFRRGSPAAEILEVARGFSADLVVVGAHGGGSGPLSGVVARRVARHAPCSVLVASLRDGKA